MSRTRVLFLCTHNSARSQIAEALLTRSGGQDFFVRSAGTERTRVNPDATRVLAELGIDWSGAKSKTLEPFVDEPWDYVITVCDAANDACPIFPNAGQREHWSLPDPSTVGGGEERQLEAYRQVRDELEIRIMEFVRRVGAAGND